MPTSFATKRSTKLRAIVYGCGVAQTFAKGRKRNMPTRRANTGSAAWLPFMLDIVAPIAKEFQEPVAGFGAATPTRANHPRPRPHPHAY